jgi:hypothetical protein
MNFLLPADRFLGPPAYPSLYPGRRPQGSFVLAYRDGLPFVHSLQGSFQAIDEAIVHDGLDSQLGAFLDARGTLRARDRIPTLAYGSNVSPMQLCLRKFGNLDGRLEDGTANIAVVCLRGSSPGFAITYMAWIAAYGSIPALLIPSHGAVESWLLLLDRSQLLRLHETEEVRTGVYAVGRQPFCLEGITIPAYGYIAGVDARPFVDNSGRLFGLADAQYRVATGEPFVPIESYGSNFSPKAQIEMMRTIDEIVRGEFKHPLFESSPDHGYLLTDWGRNQRNEINRFLKASHGQSVSRAAMHVVGDPWDVSAFDTLGDLLERLPPGPR